MDGDPELKNWLNTTFGKFFAGETVNDVPLPTNCPICGQPDHSSGTAVVANRRLNTSYVDDEKNWLISCKECFDRMFYQYEEMWADYYANCL